MKFNKGDVPWNKGKPFNQETKDKIKISLKKIMSFKKKVSFWKGKKLSLEVRLKMSERRKGANHWNWKGGGRKTQQKLIRQSFAYKEWRKSVFERDRFTCQFCFKTKCYLEADHIKPFALYPELRFILANGRTLCLSCHRKTETWGNKKLKFNLGI